MTPASLLSPVELDTICLEARTVLADSLLSSPPLIPVQLQCVAIDHSGPFLRPFPCPPSPPPPALPQALFALSRPPPWAPGDPPGLAFASAPPPPDDFAGWAGFPSAPPPPPGSVPLPVPAELLGGWTLVDTPMTVPAATMTPWEGYPASAGCGKSEEAEVPPAMSPPPPLPPACYGASPTLIGLPPPAMPPPTVRGYLQLAASGRARAVAPGELAKAPATANVHAVAAALRGRSLSPPAALGSRHDRRPTAEARPVQGRGSGTQSEDMMAQEERAPCLAARQPRLGELESAIDDAVRSPMVGATGSGVNPQATSASDPDAPEMVYSFLFTRPWRVELWVSALEQLDTRATFVFLRSVDAGEAAADAAAVAAACEAKRKQGGTLMRMRAAAESSPWPFDGCVFSACSRISLAHDGWISVSQALIHALALISRDMHVLSANNVSESI